MENPNSDPDHGSNSSKLSDEGKAAVQVDQGKLTEDVTCGLEQLSLQDNGNMKAKRSISIWDESEVISEAVAVDVEPGAFDILPEEMWLEVLDKVTDSEDIVNVIRAYPELDKASQFMKTSWLFGLVLPHLMTKQLVQEVEDELKVCLHSRELLKLRLVSKRWKYAVEKSLENHADRHPLLPRGGHAKLEPSVVTIPRNHFNYYHIWQCRLGATIFRGTDEIDAFLQEVGDHHPGTPFPGKSLHLRIQHGNFWTAIARAVSLLEKFGKHVLDLEIDCCDYNNFVGDMELCQNILRCLTLVPNLRSLITGRLFRTTDSETTRFFATPKSQTLFPQLTNLNRFEWRARSIAQSTWVTRLLETYGRKDGLRKLGIALSLSGALDLVSHGAPNLSELHKFLEDESDGNVRKIENMMKALPNHQEICKLSLSYIESSELPAKRKGKVDINELINVLAEFRLESVVLQDVRLTEGKSIPEHITPATTITSFVVNDRGGLTFDFLKLLPNLKFLSIYVNSAKAICTLSEFKKKKSSDSVGARLRSYFVRTCDPTWTIRETGSIWKDLSSLEMLSIAIATVPGFQVYTVGAQFVKEYGDKGIFRPVPFVVKPTRPPWWFEGMEDQEENEGDEMEMALNDGIEGGDNETEEDDDSVTEEED